jgi:serine/threonine-protein kinase RsbW
MQSHEHAHAFHEAPPSDLPRNGWHRLEIHDTAGVWALGKQLETEMRNLGYPRKDSFAVGVALREAVANALRHGNRGDRTRSVLISYHLSATEVLLEVTDEGFGFNPYFVPALYSEDDLGRRAPGCGLFLMRIYMSWIRFNKRGNRVTLCKRRSAQ